MHNKVILEGSMAKGYELNKVLQFCIEYLANFIPTRWKVWDDKKTHLYLMKCLKVVGIHGLWQ